MRRSALAAVAALALSTLVGTGSTTAAQAAPETGIVLPAGPSAGAPGKVRIFGDLVYTTWDRLAVTSGAAVTP